MSNEDLKALSVETGSAPLPHLPLNGVHAHPYAADQSHPHLHHYAAAPGFPVHAQAAPQPQLRKLATPLPLALFTFAATTFCLSLYNLRVGGIVVPNAILGLALVYGGFTQFLCGTYEFCNGNTFGTVACHTFGAFWLSYAVFLIDSFGVTKAFTDANGVVSPALNYSIAIYLWAWWVIIAIILLAALKTNVALVVTLVLVEIVIALLAIGNMRHSTALIQAAGGFGLATSATALYCGAAALLTPDLSYFQLPVGDLSRP